MSVVVGRRFKLTQTGCTMLPWKRADARGGIPMLPSTCRLPPLPSSLDQGSHVTLQKVNVYVFPVFSVPTMRSHLRRARSLLSPNVPFPIRSIHVVFVARFGWWQARLVSNTRPFHVDRDGPAGSHVCGPQGSEVGECASPPAPIPGIFGTDREGMPDARGLSRAFRGRTPPLSHPPEIGRWRCFPGVHGR